VAVFDKTASNPAARIARPLRCLRAQAPEVALNLHVGSHQPAIERGRDGRQLPVGIIPEHRRSDSLAYDRPVRRNHAAVLRRRHPLFEAGATAWTWERLRSHDFAGLGYHSPNMELSHRERLRRDATGFDQESDCHADPVGPLSGSPGFLPDHYPAPEPIQPSFSSARRVGEGSMLGFAAMCTCAARANQ
jgi:hypothetical protein